MVLIGKILVGHVAGIAAVGNFADGIDAEERNDGAAGILADVVIGNETLASDDEPFGRPRQVEIGDSGAADRSEEHTSELQSHRDLHSFPTRRSSDLWDLGGCRHWE